MARQESDRDLIRALFLAAAGYNFSILIFTRFLTNEVLFDVRPELDFYRGHFPGRPITPGVILLEAMAQAGVVGLGIHILSRELGPAEAEKYTTLFTDAQVEFSGIVEPGARVVTTGRKVFFRRLKLRSEVEMKLESGQVVCSGTISGMGVPR